MVSFQCEACGDVLTKKKLDPHRNGPCRAAVFTCIDCMTTFRGSDYRAHTSCITEDQKYHGALYREKPAKGAKGAKRKSVSIVEPEKSTALVPRRAYVEDAPDIDAPPTVPTPPSAVPANRDSVFDYMVSEDPPGTSQVSVTTSTEEMSMRNSAPSVFSSRRSPSPRGYRPGEAERHSAEYVENGFSWGAEPVQPRAPRLELNSSTASLEFMTPAAKELRSKLDRRDRPQIHSRTSSGEKKRKRPTDDHPPPVEADTLMVDSLDTPGIVHSGLTGGLDRMMALDDEYPFRRSPEPDQARPSRRTLLPADPNSPSKRSRHSKEDANGLGIAIKGRAVKALSMVSGALLPGADGQPASSRSRSGRRASSPDHGQAAGRVEIHEKRERKKHKVHRHGGTTSVKVRHEHRSRGRARGDEFASPSPEPGQRGLKAIEYRRHDDSASDSESGPGGGRHHGSNGAMVVFGADEKSRRACRNFLAHAPGLDSEKGYSVHKMLKRWHKHNDVRSHGGKLDEEKELWRGLRIRRNERGEHVVVI